VRCGEARDRHRHRRADRRHRRAAAEQARADGRTGQDPPRAGPAQPRRAARRRAGARRDQRPERPEPDRRVQGGRRGDRPDHDQTRRHCPRRRARRRSRAVRPADPRDRRRREDRRLAPVRPRPRRARNRGSCLMTDAPAKKPKSGWLNVLVDYGPLLVFFLTYRYYSPEGDDVAGEIFAVVRSTGAFIVAAIAALAFSKWRLGKVSPMLWLSTALIVGFGTLTIYFADEFYVQLKPTIIYLLFGIALLVGWWRGKALLQT